MQDEKSISPSQKAYTEILAQQLLLQYRADLFDSDYLIEILKAKLPKRYSAAKRKHDGKSRKHIRRKPHSPAYKPDDLLKPSKAAKVLGLAEKTLANLRSRGGGPMYHKLSNRTIRYRYADLQTFITQSAKQNTSEY